MLGTQAARATAVHDARAVYAIARMLSCAAPARPAIARDAAGEPIDTSVGVAKMRLEYFADLHSG
eukprot:11860774-Alexandrium_andersonii.AAC.1